MVQTELLLGGSGQGVGVEEHWQVGQTPEQGTKIMPLVEHYARQRAKQSKFAVHVIVVPEGSRRRTKRP